MGKFTLLRPNSKHVTFYHISDTVNIPNPCSIYNLTAEEPFYIHIYMYLYMFIYRRP